QWQQKLSQGLEDQVTLPNMQLEQYQDPRVLPCLHTYCRRCLEGMLDKARTRFAINCPECRETVKIEDVASLKVNIWVNKNLSLLELSKAEKKQGDEPEMMCNNCDRDKAAKGRCFDCNKFVCDICMTAHQRMAALRDHQVKTFEEINLTGIPAVVEKPMFCAKHKGEVQKLFCKTCEVLICRDCAIIDHKNHDFCFMVDIAQEYKEKFTKEIKTASATKKKVESSLKSVQLMQKRVKTNAAETEKNIDDVINKQIRALEEKRNCLKQESRDMTATKMKNLTAQEDGLVMHMTGLKSAIEFTENVLSKGSNSDVLSMSKQVMSRLSQLSAKPFDEKVYDVDKQVLHVDEQLLSDGIAKFAKFIVDEKVPDPGQCEIEDVASLKVNIWVNKNLSLLELSKAEKKQGGKTRIKTFVKMKVKGISAVLEKKLLCPKHKGEEQKVFCKTCEVLICRDCVIIDHKDHDFCFMVDIAQEHKEKLTKEIKTASTTKEKIESSLKSVQLMQKGVTTNAAETEKKIDDVINKQIRALEEKRNSLKQESRDMTATTMKNLTAQEDGLVMHMTGLKSAIEFTENVLSKGSNSDVLSMSKQVMSRLSQLSAKPFDGKVYDVEMQVLHVDERLISDGIATFAKVIDEMRVPDPGQCEVRWAKELNGRDAIHIYIRDSLGEAVNITRDRIELIIDKLYAKRLLDQCFTQRENGVWAIVHPAILPPHVREPLNRHVVANVNIKVDEQLIKGNSIKICYELSLFIKR
ncbi:hypothetical protein QZH41_014413, partial [Actinostola sp. cb2023]